MKVRFYCYSLTSGNGLHTGMVRGCDTGEPRKEEWFALDAKFSPEEWGQIALARPYATYLCSAMSTDFPEHFPEDMDKVLADIEKLERGEIDTAEWGGEGFCHSLTRDKVVFEHTIFGECPEWPIWTCPLSHYKAALLGWRRFIDMPKAIGTELIVELPEPE